MNPGIKYSSKEFESAIIQKEKVMAGVNRDAMSNMARRLVMVSFRKSEFKLRKNYRLLKRLKNTK